jgi:hypothetical protein
VATYTPSNGDVAGTSLDFHLLIDPPIRETVQQMAERVIPHAGLNEFPLKKNVIAIVGKAVTKIRGQARFDSYAGLTAFEHVVGTQGSLIYSEEPSGITVALVSMRRNRVTPHDIHLAAIEFWLLPASAVIQQAGVISPT